MKHQKEIKDSDPEYKSDLRRLTWKKFGMYKLIELGIIPLIVLAVGKLPLWIGWGMVKLFNVDLVHSEWYCHKTKDLVCDGINYNTGDIWSCGMVTLVVLGIFIYVNYKFANINAQEELDETKYRQVEVGSDLRRYKR